MGNLYIGSVDCHLHCEQWRSLAFRALSFSISCKMSHLRKLLISATALLCGFIFICNAGGQTPDTVDANASNDPAAVEKLERSRNLRQLQSDEFLVETAYLQDIGEFVHKFTFARKDPKTWSAVFTEEVTLGNEKHNVVFSIPAHLAGSASERSRGLGDLEVEYFYGLYGNNESRITVSPGVAVSLPTGDHHKELGSGAPGISFKIPVSILLTKRFATNSLVEATYTKSHRNSENEQASTLDYEIGQSFVWFAKPKLNVFVEALWERSQEVSGPDLKKNEHSFVISPAVRWAYEFKNGLTIAPGIAAPIGLGPSFGEHNIFFYITFAHPLSKEK